MVIFNVVGRIAVASAVILGGSGAFAQGGEVVALDFAAVATAGLAPRATFACPAECMPKMCTDEVNLKGTNTVLTYICPATPTPTKQRSTVYVTVTEYTTVTPTVGPSAPKATTVLITAEDEKTTMISVTSSKVMTITITLRRSSSPVTVTTSPALTSSGPAPSSVSTSSTTRHAMYSLPPSWNTTVIASSGTPAIHNRSMTAGPILSTGVPKIAHNTSSTATGHNSTAGLPSFVYPSAILPSVSSTGGFATPIVPTVTGIHYGSTPPYPLPSNATSSIAAPSAVNTTSSHVIPTSSLAYSLPPPEEEIEDSHRPERRQEGYANSSGPSEGVVSAYHNSISSFDFHNVTSSNNVITLTSTIVQSTGASTGTATKTPASNVHEHTTSTQVYHSEHSASAIASASSPAKGQGSSMGISLMGLLMYLALVMGWMWLI